MFFSDIFGKSSRSITEQILGNQTFVGAGKNGGTPWGLNKPHRNLEFTLWNFGWIFKLYTKRGLIGEYLSCLFFAFSLKSNCTDFFEIWNSAGGNAPTPHVRTKKMRILLSSLWFRLQTAHRHDSQQAAKHNRTILCIYPDRRAQTGSLPHLWYVQPISFFCG